MALADHSLPDATGFRHGYIKVGSGEIHYVEDGDGMPLVLVHGGYGGWVHWLANIGDLAGEYRVIAVDLPGFGESADPGRCLQPNEHAEELAALLDHLNLKRAVVAGFSFGTLVSTQLAMQRPDLVSCLVLVSLPGVGVRTDEALQLPQRMSQLAREKGKRAGIEGVLRELMLSDTERVTPALVELMSEYNARTRYITRSISRQSKMIAQLELLDISTAVLLGALDPYHSNELEGRKVRMDSALRRNATTIVADAAHWLQYEQPEVFGKIVRNLTGAMCTNVNMRQLSQ